MRLLQIFTFKHEMQVQQTEFYCYALTICLNGAVRATCALQENAKEKKVFK